MLLGVLVRNNGKVLGKGNYKGRSYFIIRDGRKKKLILSGMGIVSRLTVTLGDKSAREVAKTIIDRLS